MDLKKLGTIIRNKRVEIGIPPSILAAKLEISRPTLWVWERGENPRTGKPSRPSKHALERLTEVLHMSQAELEEILTLAGYQVSTKPTQTPNQVSATIQTGTIHQHQSSSSVTITEINDTVYYAYDGYLEAFDARTGNRLWFSSTGVSPLESAYALVVGRVKQIELSIQLHAKESRGLLFVLSGIDGIENDSVLTELKKTGINIFISPIYTTRLPYEGETQGKRRIFISEEDFKGYIAKGILLTYLYNDLRPNKPSAWYGHECAPIIQSLRMGQDVVMDAGPEEAAQLCRIIPDTILILLRPPRDINTKEEHERWEKRRQQIKYNYYVNYERGHLSEAVDKLRSIMSQEREKALEEQAASEQLESQTSNEGIFE